MGKIGKRWGPKVTYLRNWRKVNGEGIERGVFYLDFEWTQNWDKELVEMNEGKVGAPYLFPHSLIRWQAFIAQFFNYRACQGIIKIRENAVVDPGGGGSWRRGREVEFYCRWGYEDWARKKHYGRR